MVALDSILSTSCIFLASLCYVTALQCWSCSSNTEGHEEFCRDILLRNKIPERLEKTGLLTQNCSKLSQNNHNNDESKHIIPVCRKKVLKVNDETVYQRHCDFVDKRDTRSACKRENIALDSAIIDCNDCTYDYCNSSINIIPNLITFLIPLLLAKVLIF